MWVAWHLPRRVVYWSAIRLGAHATQGRFADQVVPELEFVVALERWGDDARA